MLGYLVDFEDGATRILDKIHGNDHGGGVQVAPETERFANMDRFLERLAEAASGVANKRPSWSVAKSIYSAAIGVPSTEIRGSPT